jgi:hypothetical protein
MMPLAPLPAHSPQAHIWDTSKRKQVYIGTYAEEIQAAKAHDVVALKWRGQRASVNCSVTVYADLLPLLDTISLVSFLQVPMGYARRLRCCAIQDSQGTRSGLCNFRAVRSIRMNSRSLQLRCNQGDQVTGQVFASMEQSERSGQCHRLC